MTKKNQFCVYIVSKNEKLILTVIIYFFLFYCYNMNNKLTYKVHLTSSLNNCIFDFYLNNDAIGIINFHIDYSQATIGWLCIKPTIKPNILISKHRKGYGTKMLKLFEEYIKNNHRYVKKILLIPEYFDGKNKNGLCAFYEKSGFNQETYGLPCYYKNVL